MDQRLPDPAVTAPPDWRGLCEELLRELENAIAVHYGEGGTHHISAADAVIAKADAALSQPEPEVVGPTRLRTERRNGPFGEWTALVPCNSPALAQPEPEVGPSDEELLELARAADLLHPDGTTAWVEDLDVSGFVLNFARAVLARWGRPAPAPGGERQAAPVPVASDVYIEPSEHTILVPVPVPVAVADRIPRAEDCDAVGRCWVHQPHEACPESPAWELMLAKYASANYGAVCWLPAHALPLPSGEVGS